MDDFLRQDKETIEYYIRKYCPDLPFIHEYIEPKLKPILDRLAKTDASEMEGLFWPCFNDRYDRMFISLIEKKGLAVRKCVTEDIALYPTLPGIRSGYLVQERMDDKDYFRESAIIMDDLYQSASNIDSLEIPQQKKVLMNLMRFIDSTRCFVEKTWPKIPVTEELLKNLQDKYDAYDERYDELAMLLR